MKKGFTIVLSALALGGGIARAQTTDSPRGTSAPAGQLPAAAPVLYAPPDHSSTLADGWGNGDGGSGGHLEAGFEAMIIRPYFQTNPALSTTVRTTSPDFLNSTSRIDQTNFDYKYTVNPKIWLGYAMDGGLGIRASWWQFDQAATSQTVSRTTPLPALTTVSASASAFGTLFVDSFVPGFGGGTGVPATLAATNDMRLQVWDLEATAAYHAGGLSVEGSAGVRYVHLSQSFGAFSAQSNLDVAGDSRSSTLLASHNFNGAGPTLAADLRQGLGDSGLGLYGNVRGSVLFGSKHATGLDEDLTTPAVGLSSLSVTTFNSDQLGVIGVGECEIGVEYSRKMGDAANLFVRAGIDGQLWIGAGSATSESGLLGFFGYTVTVGINY